MKLVFEFGNRGNEDVGIKNKFEDKVTEIKQNDRVEKFVKGAKKALKSKEAVYSIGLVTITQGLKYNGNVKNGVKGGLYAGAALAVIGGVLELLDEQVF